MKKLYHITEPGSNRGRKMWPFVSDALAILESSCTLEPGKKADILIVEGNSLKDISILLNKKISFGL